MIVELGSSNIITESVHNKVTKFIHRYVYGDKEVEEIIKTRMRQYHEIKTKAPQVILLDPNSLTQHTKRANIQAYYWVQCMTKDIQKCDPSLSWKREEETGTLSPLWYGCSQLPQSRNKRRRPSAHKIAQIQKTAVIDNGRPKRLSAAVAKINTELWNTDFDNEKDTDSSYGLTDFGSESDSSDPDIY